MGKVIGNEEFKQEWIKDLRSGKFKQGKNMLWNERSNTYCCLGVACKTYERLTGDDPFEQFYSEDRDAYWGLDTGCLPDIVQRFAKIGEDDSYLHSSAEGGSDIYELNDDYNYNFNRLADVIEKEL